MSLVENFDSSRSEKILWVKPIHKFWQAGCLTKNIHTFYCQRCFPRGSCFGCTEFLPCRFQAVLWKIAKDLQFSPLGGPKRVMKKFMGRCNLDFWRMKKWQNWTCSHAAGKGKRKKGWYVCLYCPIFSIAGLVFAVPKKWFVEVFFQHVQLCLESPRYCWFSVSSSNLSFSLQDCVDTHVRINSLDRVKLYCYTICTPGSQ